MSSHNKRLAGWKFFSGIPAARGAMHGLVRCVAPKRPVRRLVEDSLDLIRLHAANLGTMRACFTSSSKSSSTSAVTWLRLGVFVRVAATTERNISGAHLRPCLDTV